MNCHILKEGGRGLEERSAKIQRRPPFGLDVSLFKLAAACFLKWAPILGKTKSTVKAGNRTLFCQIPQEVPFEEPVKMYSWRDTLTESLVSLKSECTKPSHSQWLANFVANVHSQGISAARTTFFAISFAKPFAFASEFRRNA